MKSPLRTVKSRVVALVLLFVVLISLIVYTYNYFLMRDFSRRTRVHSAEFNLQLVAGSLEQDLHEIEFMAAWSGSLTGPAGRYFSSPYSPILAVSSYDALNDQFLISRARMYMLRIIAVDKSGSRILHTGTNPAVSDILNSENVRRIMTWEESEKILFHELIPDPFGRQSGDVIALTAPVWSTREQIMGRVYMSISNTILTDKLKGYNLPGAASLYFDINDHSYRITDTKFEKVETAYTVLKEEKGMTSGLNTRVFRALENGSEVLVINCAVHDGITLSQTIPFKGPAIYVGNWGRLLIGIIFLIFTLAIIMIFSMNYTISQPVARIREKIHAIAGGDFSCDPGIESDTEIGEVGRGINHLSREVLDLMETRLTDEQRKKDLEYSLLQSQMNPHFIYNTLNSIKWMATLQKAEGIAEMTTAFSRLLKTVAKDNRKLVPLKDELSLLDDYYIIQQYRYGGSVKFEKHIEDNELLTCLLPRFSLQPLMEDAIFHGIEPKGAGGVILTVKRNGQDVLISIEDDGIGMPKKIIYEILNGIRKGEKGSTRGLGLISVGERIKNVFGSSYGFIIESEEGRYTRIVLKIPFKKEGVS